MRFVLKGSSDVAATFTPTVGKLNNRSTFLSDDDNSFAFHPFVVSAPLSKKSLLEIYFDKLYRRTVAKRRRVI